MDETPLRASVRAVSAAPRAPTKKSEPSQSVLIFGSFGLS